jgi:hypothetical protein
LCREEFHKLKYGLALIHDSYWNCGKERDEGLEQKKDDKRIQKMRRREEEWEMKSNGGERHQFLTIV